MSEVTVNVISLYKLCEDKLALLDQLRAWNLIPSTLQCQKCGGSLRLNEDSSRIDGWLWRCRNKYSRRKQKMKICGNTILAFVNLWVSNATLQLIQEQLEISFATCMYWSSFCREVLLTHFVDNRTKIGGPGVTVEIDEAKFGTRKFHNGRHVEGHWVFGGYERGTGRAFMVTVEDCGADSLIPLIEQWIQPGTTIVSDYWRTYGCLSRQSYINLQGTLSIFYKVPDTAARSCIDSWWKAAKATTTPSGRRKALIPGNLARYIFYKKCAELKLNRSEEFFRLAGAQYDASLPLPEEEEEEEYDDMDTEDLEF